MNINELTDEQKAKVLACKTPEDILALAKAEGYSLSDEELEAISGGEGKLGWNEPYVCSNYAC